MAGHCAGCGAALAPGARFCGSCGTPLGGAARPSGVARSAGPPDDEEDGEPAPPPKKGMSTGLIVLICVGGVLFLCVPGIAIVAAIAIPNLLAAKLSANEVAAMATLRNLTTCQAQFQTSGKVDGDGDGNGEFGTFLEMTGTTGLRAGFRPAGGGQEDSGGFEQQGSRLTPAYLTASLSNVGPNGVLVKSGYCFLIYLPDSSRKGGWTHETGPAERPGFAGGTGRVGVQAAEGRWCAYAWPLVRGNTGNRCFFVNQEGDVFQSRNEVAKHEGTVTPPGPDSALVPGTDRPALGIVGADGDVWKGGL